MGYARLLSNKPLLVNDTMRRPLSSTSSGNHRLSIENDIDKILCKALGKNVVSTISKMNTLGMMNPFYDSQDILLSSTNSVHQPVYIERDDGEEGDANIIEEDDTLDTISCTSSESDESSDDSGIDQPLACEVRCSCYSSYVYRYSISISASILLCTITDFNFNS